MFKFFKSKEFKMMAPLTGKAVAISQVPDEVFAQKMLGDGVAIEPTNGLVVAPCAGKVVQIFPTNHAVGIETKEGFDILIHLGIDTVELDGEGFERLVEEGQTVEMGTPLIKMDLEKVKEKGKSIITPVIVTTMDKVSNMETMTGDVVAGKDTIISIKVK